jgi:OmpA-OmpF porin, OOP family
LFQKLGHIEQDLPQLLFLYGPSGHNPPRASPLITFLGLTGRFVLPTAHSSAVGARLSSLENFMTHFNARLAAAVCAALLAPLAAQAQTTAQTVGTRGTTTANTTTSGWTSSNWYDDRWYVTPLIGYTWADDMRHADSGMNYGIAVGKPISPNFNIELRALYEKLDGFAGGVGDYKNWTVGIDGQWFPLGRTGWDNRLRLNPYLVAGIGGINDKNNFRNATSFMANVGAGVVWPISDSFRLVADIRYRYDDNRDKINRGRDDNFGEWVGTIGVQIPFGPMTPVAQPVRVAAPVAPPPAPVMPMPAPAPRPVMPAPVPVPMPAAAAPAPAPQPITRSAEISADGMFGFDSAELSAAGRTRIEQAVNGLRGQGITNVTGVKVVGHTDPLGAADYNQRLSEARANSVKSFLSTLGIPAGVISATGAGESQPKITEADCRAKGAKNQSQMVACLAPDRRVELSVTGTGARP